MSRFTRETNRRSPQSCSARVTRRKLLRTAVTAGAGAIAMPLVLPSRLFGAAAPSNRLNVAAVGTGGRCQALMTEVLRQGGWVDRDRVDSQDFPVGKGFQCPEPDPLPCLLLLDPLPLVFLVQAFYLHPSQQEHVSLYNTRYLLP